MVDDFEAFNGLTPLTAEHSLKNVAITNLMLSQ